MNENNFQRSDNVNFAKRLTIALHKNINLGLRALILALSGLLTGLTIAFPQIGFLEWISIVPAGVILLRRASHKKTKLRSIYFDGLVFFYFFYLVCYHFFLSMYPLDFISGITNGTALAVVLIAWLGLALLQALMGAFVFLFCAVIFRGGICLRLPILKPVVVASLWAFFEWIQNFGWWGVPWGKLPLGQTTYIVGIQNASYLGSYFLTFVIVLVNLCVALAILKASKQRIVKSALIIVASTIAFQYLSGTLIWFTTDIEEGSSTRVACVQGNVYAGNVWTSETFDQIEEVYWEQTRLAAQEGAEIVLWAETAIPFDITSPFYRKYDTMCRDLAEETNTYLLVGAYSSDDDASYNSLICYAPNGERFDTTYNKRRLVPFGEFVPMREAFEVLIPPLTDIIITVDDCVAGDSANIMQIGDDDVGSLICFDSIYDGLLRDTIREGADFICLSTNDSWFSGSAALRMHNSHAQLRAIESGRYIARSASTGISTVISPRGEILAELEADVEGQITYDVHTRENKTLWYYLGDVFVYLCIIFCVALFGEKIVKNFIKKRKKALDKVKKM